MKTKVVILSILIALVLSAAVYAGGGKQGGGLTLEKGVLSVGMEIGYPPMEYYDSDGKTELGFDVQLSKLIAEKMGLQVKYVNTAWDGIFAGVNSNKYDCIISAVTITPERKVQYNMTRPYINNTQAMVLMKGSQVSARTPEQLGGLQVGLQGETTSDDYMSELVDGGLRTTIRRYDQVINAFDELRFNRVDAVVCDVVVAYFYAGGPSSPYDIVWEGDAEEYLGIVVKKANSELHKAINDVLGEFFADGTLQRLSQSVFSRDLVTAVRNKN